MPAWLFSGLASLAGAALTRRSAKKEAARIAAANRAEAARIQKANAAAAAQAQKQNTQVRQNYYKNVVSDAQAAGINPLTALRTGGGAGYATAVAGTMANPVMLEGVYQAPTLSRNPLAAGLEAATNTYLSELTRQKQYTHEGRMDELNKSLIRAQIASMQSEMSRNIHGAEFFGNNKGNSASTRPLIDKTTTVDGMSVNEDLVSGWHAMTLPNGMIVPMPFDPQDSDLGAMAGSTVRVLGIEAPLMAGANLKDWVSGNRAKRKMREIYTNVNRDAILRRLKTMQNELSFGMKPKIQPLTRNNHFLTMPK